MAAGLPRLAPARGRRRRTVAVAAMGAPGLEKGEGKTATVRSKASGDALEVCRVVNGMWQVSGASWGRAAPRAAVAAMLAYADGGLATFDMADICE
uniref:NADP-dependent oxidoreductase domain-containing protein n=1 Tax=Aegilops tauschii TaxID=37682 RepID=N1QYM6_AEGTA